MEEIETLELMPEDEIEADLSEEEQTSEPEAESEPETEEDESAETSESSEEEAENEETPETEENPETEEQLTGSDLEDVEAVTAGENVIILPDGYEAAIQYLVYDEESVAAIVESLEYQTGIIRGGFIGLGFLIGLIAGIVFVHGFRLRRV